MRFEVRLVDRVGGTLLAASDFDDEAVAARLCAHLRSLAPACAAFVRRGAKGRQVQVISILTDEAPPDIKAGNIFENAARAAAALGIPYATGVSQALRAAEAAGETSAVVRGVEVRYIDTLGRGD
jgi:hypothetical protein